MSRYQRNILSENFSEQSQLLLSKAHVLVVGAGGLGSYVLHHLAAIGVGHIGIAEFDEVSLSNLNRQILYTTPDIGKSKAECAKKRLNALNPDVKITLHPYRFTKESGMEMIDRYDIVVDCTDNFAVRIDMDTICQSAKKPLVHASIASFKGQATTFNYAPNTPTYQSFYGIEHVEDSQAVGALSPIVGVVGSIQASEVVKIITHIGTPLYQRLLTVDLNSGKFTEFSFA
ncbi:MAG: HesA/MoeB/ThiF family protein [Rikenellaceae bacterium]